MKRLVLSTLCTFLAVSLAFATEECTFAPTAKITNITDGATYRTETTIQLSGATSTPNNCSGYITEYRWRLLPSGGSWSTLYTGSSSTYNHTFTVPANVHEQDYTLELRVKNNINLYNTKTITVTIKRPQRVYHLKDHIGNVRTSVDVEGNVVGYDDYYPFGLVMPGRSDNTSNPNDDYKFTGHEQDDEAELTMVHMNARAYDPVLGRFNQVDPMLEFTSPYTYVGNNPLNLIDPTGMFSQSPAYYINGMRVPKVVARNLMEDNYRFKEENAIENITPENQEAATNQPEPDFGPNPYYGEMEYFEDDLIAYGLQLMWLLSHPGKEEGVAVELAAYILEDENGKFSMVIFNPGTYGNTSRSGSFYLPTYDGKNTTYRGRHVVAFIHTHPGWNVNGNIVGGGNAPSDTDLATGRKYNMQGFIIGQRGISHFSTQGKSTFLGSKGQFFQGNFFLEEAIKRYR